MSHDDLGAKRVEELGIGSNLQEFNRNTLSKALETATTDNAQKARAAEMGAHLRSVREKKQHPIKFLPYKYELREMLTTLKASFDQC